MQTTEVGTGIAFGRFQLRIQQVALPAFLESVPCEIRITLVVAWLGSRRIRASSRIASAVPKGRGANNESKSCSSINLLRQLCMHRTKSHFTGKRVCRDLCSHAHAKWIFVVGPDALKHLNDGTSYRENAFQEAGGGVYGYSIGWRTGEET